MCSCVITGKGHGCWCEREVQRRSEMEAWLLANYPLYPNLGVLEVHTATGEQVQELDVRG